MAKTKAEVFIPAVLPEGALFKLKHNQSRSIGGIPESYVGRTFILRDHVIGSGRVHANVYNENETYARWLVSYDMMAPVDESTVKKPKCADGTFNAGFTGFGNSVLVETLGGQMKVSVGYIDDQATFADARKELRKWARNMLRETMLLIDSAEAMAKARGMIPPAQKGKAKNGRRRKRKKA